MCCGLVRCIGRIVRSPCLFLLCLIPAVTFILLFSDMGYGREIYTFLHKLTFLSGNFFFLGILMLMVVYLLDAGNHVHNNRAINCMFQSICSILRSCGIALLIAGAVLKVDDFPTAPMAVLLLMIPTFLGFGYRFFFRRIMSAEQYLLEVSYPLIVVSLLCIIFWVLSVFGKDNVKKLANLVLQNGTMVEKVSNTTFLNDMNLLFCKNMSVTGEGTHIFDIDVSVDAASSQYLACFPEFLFWFSPFLCGIAYLFLAVFCSMLSKGSGSKNKKQNEDESEVDSMVETLVRSVLYLITFAFVAVFISSSMAGLNMALADVMASLCIALAIVVVLFLGSFMDNGAIGEQVMEVPTVKKIAGSFMSIWLKALLVLIAAPFSVALIIAYKINLFMRHTLGFKTKFEMSETELKESGESTSNSSIFALSAIAEWPWAVVLDTAMLLGLLLISCQVGVGKLVTLFLSYLNEALSSFPLVTVIIVFSLIGLGMFLLPPVPGVPVYVAGGVIISNAAMRVMDFWPAMVLSSVVCFGIKLLAIVVQMKVFGGMLGKFVSVRQMVGVNSIEIRAIRKILSVRGCSIPKTLILCGGPDWPTSVLTGILNLPLCDMLLGSLPVYLLIAPTCFSSALMLKASEGPKWIAAGSIMLSVASIMQGGALLGAGLVINRVAERDVAELEAMPDDEPVKMLDAKARVRKQWRDEVTDWHATEGRWSFPACTKACLLLGVMLMSTAMYNFFLFPQDCFHTFALTDSISTKLDGKPSNLVKPMGWIGIGLFVAACVLKILYGKWASSRLKRLVPLKKKEAKQAARDAKKGSVVRKKVSKKLVI